VTLKALCSNEVTRLSRKHKVSWTIVGELPGGAHGRSLRRLSPKIGFQWVLPPFGSPGFQAGWSIEYAATALLRGEGDALVTGPIDKARLNHGGYSFPGHTEMLQHLSAQFLQEQLGRKTLPVLPVTMMLSNSKMRVSLVTTHLGLSKVPGALKSSAILQTILHTEHYLRSYCDIATPRIAVCALNPHSGEGGLFGNEEARIIQPAIASAKRALSRRSRIVGPISADTLFALELKDRRYDAIVCMYHDQGLIPIKLLDFAGTVNITLNLPLIRTSVDHGVAFDIAGRNLADPGSMIAAIKLAVELATNNNNKRGP
jgi:4-hydroxythreonine-4-phosphate dehydrogenase